MTAAPNFKLASRTRDHGCPAGHAHHAGARRSSHEKKGKQNHQQSDKKLVSRIPFGERKDAKQCKEWKSQSPVDRTASAVLPPRTITVSPHTPLPQASRHCRTTDKLTKSIRLANDCNSSSLPPRRIQKLRFLLVSLAVSDQPLAI